MADRSLITRGLCTIAAVAGKGLQLSNTILALPFRPFRSHVKAGGTLRVAAPAVATHTNSPNINKATLKARMPSLRFGFLGDLLEHGCVIALQDRTVPYTPQCGPRATGAGYAIPHILHAERTATRRSLHLRPAGGECGVAANARPIRGAAVRRCYSTTVSNPK